VGVGVGLTDGTSMKASISPLLSVATPAISPRLLIE